MRTPKLAAGLLLLALNASASTEPSATTTPPRLEASGRAILELRSEWWAMADKQGRLDTFQGRDLPVSAETAVFSGDETWIATTSKGDYAVRVFEAASGRQIWSAAGEAETESAVFTHDHQYVVTGGEADPELRVWKREDGSPVRGLSDRQSVEGMRFNPAGTLLAAGNEAGQVRLYDTSAEHPRDWPAAPVHILTHGPDVDLSGKADDGHADVNQLDWSPDGAFLYSGGRNGVVKKWSAARFAEGDGALVRTYRGHDGSIKATRLSADGRFIAAASGTLAGKGPSRVTLWREDTGELLLSYPAGEALRVIETVAFDPSGRLLLAGGSSVDWQRERSPTLVWWIPEVLAGKQEPVQTLVWYDVEYLTFNRRGDRLLGAHADGSIRLWQVKVNAP